MSTAIVLLVLVPFVVLVAVFGTVVVVALVQAKPEDVPAVMKESIAVFRRLADRVPSPPHHLGEMDGAATGPEMHTDGGIAAVEEGCP